MSNQAEAMMQDQIDGAISENEALRDATRWRETGEEDPCEGQEVLAAIWPYGNKANRMLIVHAVYSNGQWLCPAEHTSLHQPGYWMPAPALPDVAQRLKLTRAEGVASNAQLGGCLKSEEDHARRKRLADRDGVR